MSDGDVTVKARESVERMLSALHVACVVCVDDTYGGHTAVEDVIAAARLLDSDELADAIPELGDVQDADVQSQKLRLIWGTLNENEKRERANAVLIAARRRGDEDADDAADASILGELIPQGRLSTMSPSEWGRQRDALLQRGGKERTLFLFDQDLSDDGGDTEGGIKIIASLLASNDTGSVICGLLTHTVTPETQAEQWTALSRKYEIPKDRFIVIPKLYLSKEPVLFAQALKFVALCPEFTELKQKTKKIIAAATTKASDRVDEVSIFDLDHIVFRVSAEEGLWEPDMLFRLHALFHRLEARRLAHENGQLEDIAARLRIVSDIPTDCAFQPPSNAWTIQRDELFEWDSHINRNHLPLEVGDIFERVNGDSQKSYVLLAQPCDLMVRSDGRRHPELKHVPVAEVVPGEEAPAHSAELPYYGPSPSERWHVKLRRVHQVRTYVLDLCVMNTDGVSRFTLDGDVPSGMRPSLKARHSRLLRLMRPTVRKADLLAPVAKEPGDVAQLRASIGKEFSSSLWDEGLFKGELRQENGARIVVYNCRRVARASRARAIGLLMAYTASLGRSAYERDFGEVGYGVAP